MGLKEQISNYLSNEISAIVLVENKSGRIVYENSILQQYYGKSLQNEIASDVLGWIMDCPPLSCEKSTEWEAMDLVLRKYFKVESKVMKEGDEEFSLHHLTDVTEYMKLNSDVTKYMSFFKKLSGFQTAILENLSSTYYDMLPMLSDFFKVDKVCFLLHRDANIEMMLYDKKSKNCQNGRIATEEESLKAFAYENRMTMSVEAFSPALKDFFVNSGLCTDTELCSVCNGGVSEQDYAVFFGVTPKMDKESMEEETLLSVIRLYIENAMMREKLIYDSEHDGLTGMYNKGKYLSMLESDYRNMDSIGIFNFDVNNLKKMNDTYGHEAGDRLIIKGADSIRKVTGSNVHGYRMGGDEFLMIACNVTQKQVDELKETWEKELARLNTKNDGILCVIAVGVAYGEKDYDFDALMKLADERMYEDKKSKKKPGEEIR